MSTIQDEIDALIERINSDEFTNEDCRLANEACYNRSVNLQLLPPKALELNELLDRLCKLSNDQYAVEKFIDRLERKMTVDEFPY